MVRRIPDEDPEPLPPPATSLEGREDQLTALAYNVVEKRMRDGTASATETTHFLKAGSRATQFMLEKLQNENEVLRARVREMESRPSESAIVEEAYRAFRGYSGQDPIAEGGDPDWEYGEDVY